MGSVMSIANAQKNIYRTKVFYNEELNEDNGLFDEFYVPFLLDFRKNVFALIENVSKSNKIAFNIESVMDDCLMSIKNELINLSIKSLITKIHEFRNNNMLFSKNSTEKYKEFIVKMKDSNFAVIRKDYPELFVLIEKKICRKLELIEDIFTRLDKDVKVITDDLEMNFSKVFHVFFNEGDSHNGGKSVAILEFASGAKLVYKPHSLTGDMKFEKIIKWINSYKVGPEILTPITINRDGYGWQEYIRYHECVRIKQVHDCFNRLGMLLAVFYVLKTGDLHHENIIISGEYPMVIDLETLFSLNNDFKFKDGMMKSFLDEINNSVFGTMILPQNFAICNVDIDFSVLTADEGKESKKIDTFKIVNQGTDEIRIIKTKVLSESSNNRVKFGTEKVNPSIYSDDICKGFRKCYKLILRQKQAFANFIVDESANSEKYRQVIRPTYIYSKYLEAATHPKYMTSKKERSNLFSMLMRNASDNKFDLRIRSEIKDLFECDIPCFTAEFGTGDLYSGNELVAKGYYKETISDMVASRIMGLSDEDMYKQMSYIKMSLQLAKNNIWSVSEMQTVRKHRDSTASNNSMLNLTKHIGDWLYSTAIWSTNKDSCSWITLNITDDNKYQLGPINGTLYEGIGVILFLLYLGSETGDEKYINLAESAFAGVLDMHLGDVDSVAAFLGKGSILYLLHTLWEITRKIEYKEQMEMMIDVLLHYDADTTECDIIRGTAGLIVLCANIYKKNNLDKLLNIVRRYTEILQEKIAGKEIEIYTGYAHGLSGYAHAFYEAAEVLCEKKYLDYAYRLFAIEDSYYVPGKQNWKDLREDAEENDLTYWCQGRAGITMSRAICKRYPRLDQDQEMHIVNSVKHIIDDGLNVESQCLCHGIFGNIDILIKLSEIVEDEETREDIQIGINRIKENLKELSVKSILESVDYNSSLMLGYSGIGYAILRMINPSLPCVLALEVM